MPLSWNEIRRRAIAFSKEWRGETREAPERQSFRKEFFNVLGMWRRAVASFEEPVRKLSNLYAPLTMPGPLLRAHPELDRAVDRCYRPEPFPSDRHRVEYLFALYEKLTAPTEPDGAPAGHPGKCQASCRAWCGFAIQLCGN
jgi:hypothetical protein